MTGRKFLDEVTLPSDKFGKTARARTFLARAYNEGRDDEEVMEGLTKLMLIILFKITGKMYAPVEDDKPVADPKPKRVRTKAATGK